MKTPRYKFDDVWMKAIRLMPYISEEYTERMIRDYIEGKRTEEYVNHEFLETYFECAWVLIKERIDSRKERNERARLKRVARREAVLAEAARLKAAEDERIAREEAARKAQAEAAEALRKERARKRRERHVDRTNCISRGKGVAAGSMRASAKESSSKSECFADRFRGPAWRSAAKIGKPESSNLPDGERDSRSEALKKYEAEQSAVGCAGRGPLAGVGGGERDTLGEGQPGCRGGLVDSFLDGPGAQQHSVVIPPFGLFGGGEHP